jgi:polysaccharide export outer membrane protein
MFFPAALATLALFWVSPASAADYILGPQDTLKIRVFEWRPSTGTVFEWVPLTGEFVISAAGNLSLPIIGTVPAAGMTLEQVSQNIGERLQMQAEAPQCLCRGVRISAVLHHRDGHESRKI